MPPNPPPPPSKILPKNTQIRGTLLIPPPGSIFSKLYFPLQQKDEGTMNAYDTGKSIQVGSVFYPSKVDKMRTRYSRGPSG